MKRFLLLLFVALASAKVHILSDEFIEAINQRQSTWKAGRNFAEDTPLEHLKGLLGVLPGNGGIELPKRTGMIPEGFELPDSFDSIDAWPECMIIREVRDQGSCGSCWAFGAASVMSDRECIHSGGESHFRYSTEDLVSCCYSCGFGCDGGWLQSTFDYWLNTGIVSGGRYDSKQGCKPYSIAECEHHVEGDRPPCEGTGPTPDCKESCISEYELGYEEDRHFAENVYGFEQDEEEIKYEIFTNGPVEASFDVYDDFFNYKSGVYQHTEGSYKGGHAIHIIGWGVENDTPYWTAVNSWNSDWGDEGRFKILRGENECAIEGNIAAGIPKKP